MPSESDRIILVGVFHEAIELAEECGKHIVGLVHPTLRGVYAGYPILGDDDEAARLHREYPGVAVSICLDPPQQRARLVAHYTRAGFDFGSLIHPQAKISRSAACGVGAMINFGANVSTNVRLGDHVRVNVYANIMHDVQVGSFSTIAPNAVILGRVHIQQHCYIGAHCTIMPDLEVGEGGQVGAHANVTRAVPAGSIVVGNPARSPA